VLLLRTEKEVAIQKLAKTPERSEVLAIRSSQKSSRRFSIAKSAQQQQRRRDIKMAPSPLQQRRTHNTLLFQKLLNLRDGASPFTLVLDTLEQSGGAVVREFAGRAQVCIFSL